jgi:uncharacterized phiE125 gp8 family phage protein
MMALRLVAGPESEPLSLAEAKEHVKPAEGVASENSRLERAIAAVRELAEQKTGRALITQSWRRTLDEFPDAIRLDHPPIQGVTHIKYFDTDGDQITLAAESYQLDSESEPGWIVPAPGYSWPATQSRANAVEVQYVAGYTDAAAVPKAIMQWMLAVISAVFDGRAPETIDTTFIDHLIDRYCVEQM